MLIESHITPTKPDLRAAIVRAGFTPGHQNQVGPFHRVFSVESAPGCYGHPQATAAWDEESGRFTLLA